jgi:gamma-glutamylcyclotransferase
VTRPGGSLPYFAYGANLHPGWLRQRAPCAAQLGPGELQGYRIRFHKRGRDGAGRSNAWHTGEAGDRLPGALYRLAAEDLDRLGAAGAGYHAEEVLVQTAAGPLTAIAWCADPEEIEDGLRPWDWYLALIRAGAEMHGLPGPYRLWLESVPVCVDPDRERAARALAVMRATASAAS